MGIQGHAAQMGHFYTKKPLDIGPIFSKKIRKHGSIFIDSSQILNTHKLQEICMYLNKNP